MTLIPLTWAKPPLSANDRGHTRYSPFVRVKNEARWSVRKANPQPVDRANVTLHWRIPTRHLRDSDNLFSTLKACQDALVAEGVLPADDWRHVPRASCEIHPPNGEPAAMWLTLDDPDQEEP